MSLIKENNEQKLTTKGILSNKLTERRDELERLSVQHEEKDESIKNFSGNNPVMIGDCETYAQEKLLKSNLEELNSTYESTLKNFKTRTDSLKKDYTELVRGYEQEFHHFLNLEPSENIKVKTLL